VHSNLIAGRYTVERELGQGASAMVYLARDAKGGRLVALKVLRHEFAESFGTDRFLREIRLTEQLHHPNILGVLDSGADRGIVYCVLPYMDGGTLRDWLDRDKQLGIDDAVRVARTIADALQYAHARNLVHRDIKPENILFSGREACLGDFGIARVLHAPAGDTTTAGIVRGTPAYMSPEQGSGERGYDGRSDIYSLGCVVYEMITGTAPFDGATAQAVLAQRFLRAPRSMHSVRRDVPRMLDRVVQRAMANAPEDRYSTAELFGDALTQSVLGTA
jgi:serine/threonine-protein kinase